MRVTMIAIIFFLMIMGNLFAGWTPFMQVWDTDNWDWRFDGESVYTDSIGNCIILSAGCFDSDTLFIDAFVYNREFSCFDTFKAILKHPLTMSYFIPSVFFPYFSFHNLITLDGIILLPVVMPPHHVYYITFDGEIFTPHYLPLPESSSVDCQMRIIAQMRERGILSLAITNFNGTSGCCSTYVFPDVTDPDSIIAIWPELSPVRVEGFAYKNGSIYLLYYWIFSGSSRLSRFDGDSETVMWEMSPARGFLFKESLKTYAANSGNFIIIDSAGYIDTIYAHLGGTFNERPIVSRSGNEILGWLLHFPHDSIFTFLWFEDTEATIETTIFEGPIELPFYGLAETTPGTIYGVTTSSVYPTGILGFFAYHDTIVSGIREETGNAPEEYEISVFPNPFNSSVRIAVEGECDSPMQIEIYDVAGRLVTEITPPAPLDRGEYGKSPLSKGDLGGLFVWQPAPSLPSGVYLVRARAGEESVAKRIVYLK